MDFEEELEAIFISKTHQEQNYDSKQHGNKKLNIKVFDYIPLMLRDLSALKQDSWKDQNVISIFNGRFHFKTCLVYCIVVSKTERGERYVYTVDDGTASMEMSNLRKPKDLKWISNIENKLNAAQTETHAQNEDNITTSLRKLLAVAKEQLNSNAEVDVGTKVLVLGRPSYFREKVSLGAFHILKDVSADSSLEISYKDELIGWYVKNLHQS